MTPPATAGDPVICHLPSNFVNGPVMSEAVAIMTGATEVDMTDEEMSRPASEMAAA